MNIQAAGVFLRILLMLPITVLLATVPASAADRFSGSTYTITVPDGWVRIPPYLVTRQLGDFSRNRVLFPVAFQLESDKTWFSYPYVIIQTYDYPEGTEPTDTWIKQFAQQAGGSDATPQVDLRSHSFATIMRQNVKGIGPVTVQINGHIGRTQAVKINAYARDSDLGTYKPQFGQINDSFQWDRGEEYQEQPSTSSKLLGRVVGGAIIAIIVGVLRTVMKKRKTT